MKYLFSSFIALITFNLIAEKEIPDYATIIKTEKDSTLSIGQSVLIIKVQSKYFGGPLTNAKVHLDTNIYLGKTDTSGYLNTTIESGVKRFCVDTELKNSLVTNFTFLSQHIYTIHVIMNSEKITQSPDQIIYDVAEKPVIYLYPTKKQKINIKVTPKNEFLFTYPKYPKNGWNVTAYPNGKIDYNNRTYNYLFWEGMYPPIIEQKEKTGFIVNSDTLISFFEHSLTTIGLNSEEQADFITYWGPKLMENQLNYIHFYFNDDCEKFISSLETSPKPTTLIRVFMTYQIVDVETDIKSQSLPSFKREGFTVVEWGGSYN